MAYDTANPPRGIPFGIAGPMLWYYSDTDDDGTVVGSDYFSDGDDLGMKIGDPLFSYESDAKVMTVMYVDAVTAGGAATVKVVVVTT